MADSVTCPFCGFNDPLEYQVQLHIEHHHTEDSPFVSRGEQPVAGGSATPASAHSPSATQDLRPASPTDRWTRCTRPKCGEWVLLSDANEHLDMHDAITRVDAEEDKSKPSSSPPASPENRYPDLPRQLSNREPDIPPRSSSRVLQKSRSRSKSGSHASTGLLQNLFGGSSSHAGSSRSVTSSIRRLSKPRDPGRLGKRELGPYAFEERMPESVRRCLLEDAQPQRVQRIGKNGWLIQDTFVSNETSGLVPAIADLCALDEDTDTTYLCHPSVRHVRRLYCDGNFCGYWNIQMLLTYVQHMRPDGPQKIPHVPKIQSLIERAWDEGICTYSRIETGGVRDTRKWIGTQEALAFFTYIDVPVEPLSVADGPEGSGKTAVEDLLDYVEAYFMSGIEGASIQGTSFITQLGPIYFQRFGHSMTIIGLERRANGSRNLLLFDSSFPTSAAMGRLLAHRRTWSPIADILRPYRRTELSLTRWREFELIVPHKLDS